MAKVQIRNVSHKHRALADVIIANPMMTLQEISSLTGYTPSWISVVTNSEMFRDYLYSRQQEQTLAYQIGLREKLEGVAHAAVEKLGKMVDNSHDPDFILAAADKTLGRLGYGAPKQGGVNVQVNGTGSKAEVPAVSIEIIQQAREKLYRIAGREDPNGPRMSAPKALPPSSDYLELDDVSETGVYSEGESEGGESSGGGV